MRFVFQRGRRQNVFTLRSKNGNTVTFTFLLDGFSPKISPADVNINTYKVYVPGDLSTLDVLDGKGGKWNGGIVHGNSFEFRLQEKTGYTNGEPKVYVGDSNHPLAGVDQGNNVYKYTITGIAANKRLDIQREAAEKTPLLFS